MGRERKREEREANHERLLKIENEGLMEGDGWEGDGLDGGWVLRRTLVMSIGCCM